LFFELNDEQQATRQRARDFAEKRISVVQREGEETGVFHTREVVREMGELGFFGGVIPREYGGTEAGFLSTMLVIEEIGRISASYCMLPTNQTVGPGLALLRNGTKEQKDKYLPRLVKGEIIGCFGATEPDAGSDLSSMKTVAVERDDSFVLNGNKMWITLSPEADMGLFWAWTDKERGLRDGVSCFIVDIKATPGIATSEIRKLGLACDEVGEVAFSDARVPKENLLGRRGDGYGLLMRLLTNTRLCAGARAIGVHGACLEDCINYVKQQKTSDRELANYQMLQSKIAEMHIEHEAARMLIYQVAANKDRGNETPVDVPTAKYFACEAAVRAAETTMKLHGCFGFPREVSLRRYLNDSRAFPITEGTRNILRLIVGSQLLKSA
jgi:glutaryl-CoA dehydrogenase (non-decarboxylating)